MKKILSLTETIADALNNQLLIIHKIKKIINSRYHYFLYPKEVLLFVQRMYRTVNWNVKREELRSSLLRRIKT